MSDAFEFPELEAGVRVGGGSIDTDSAAAILVAAALLALIGLRVSFPKG